MRTVLVEAFCVILLITLPTSILLIPVSAAPIPLGTCPSTGQVVISTSETWSNLTCSHIGNILIEGGGSLAMVNSTLTQNGNATGSSIILNGSARVSLVSSSLSFTNGPNSLAILQGASLAVSQRSSIVGPRILVGDGGVLTANESSVLDPQSLVAGGTSTVVLNSTTLALQTVTSAVTSTTTAASSSSSSTSAGRGSTSVTTSSTSSTAGPAAAGTLVIRGYKLLIDNSVVSLAYSTNTSLSALQTVVLGSKISSFGVIGMQVGNSTVASSNTIIGASTFAVENSLSTTLTFYGLGQLQVVNSNIMNYVSSQGPHPTSKLLFQGGAVSIVASSILSSSRELYGFAPVSRSNLNVSATSNLLVSQSQLTSGATKDPGTFNVSALQMRSQTNATIQQSEVQSLSSYPSIQIGATSPSALNTLTISQSTLTTQNGTGTVDLSSGRGIVLSETKVIAPGSILSAFADELDAYNSRLEVANVTAGLVFGTSVQQGNLYNVTISGCSSPIGASCLNAVRSGQYFIYGWLFVHVASSPQNTPAAGANVTVVDATTGATDYTATTNSSGWAKILTLINQVQKGTRKPGSATPIARPTFVVQASMQGLSSPQYLVTSNNTFYASLRLSVSNTPTQADILAMGSRQLSTNFNLNNFTLPVTSPEVAAIGNYLGAGYTPILHIVSAAAPLKLRANGTHTEVDFNTVGAPGPSDLFILIYPKNMTTAPLTVSVDNAKASAQSFSNSTYYFTVFSVASGSHAVALQYIAPSGYYAVAAHPYVYPSRLVIIGVIFLGLLGLLLILVFVRGREKKGYPDRSAGAAPASSTVAGSG